MNIVITINSDIDNFIVTLIVAVTAFIFLLKWLKNKFESRTPRLASFFENEIEDHLEPYTFNFQNSIIDVKVYSIRTKIIALILSLLLIVLPLYEIIQTLEPVVAFYGFSCLPY